MSKISMGKMAVRKMALLLLDEDNGIDAEAFTLLHGLLSETGNEDIIEAVDIAENRAYVGEDFAAEELTKMEQMKESCAWTLKGMGYETECGMTDMVYKEGYCDCGKKIIMEPISEARIEDPIDE